MSILVHSVSGAPRPWRVLLALTFKKLDFDIKYMRADRGEHKAEPYLTLNPRGTVPTIEADGIVLRDSIAALAWLDRAYSDYPLFGKSPREAAIVWQITLESCDYLRSAGDLLLRPIFFQGARSATSDLRDAAVLFQKELARLETLLNLNPFLAGASPSAADAVSFPEVRILQRCVETHGSLMSSLGFHQPLSDFPKVNAWKDRIQLLEGYEKTQPPHWSA